MCGCGLFREVILRSVDLTLVAALFTWGEAPKPSKLGKLVCLFTGVKQNSDAPDSGSV